MFRKSILAVLFLVYGLLAIPTFAQGDSNLITLNDQTPAVDVVITLPADATGVVSLQVSMASVTVVDSAGTVVFQQADPRVRGLELRIAPNLGAHTLTIERLPGVTEAYAQIDTLPELTGQAAPSPSIELVSTGDTSISRSATFQLSSATPGSNFDFAVAQGTYGALQAQFPGISAVAQVTDRGGVVLATSYADIDGMNIVLEGGDYTYTMVANQLTSDASASVAFTPADQIGFSPIAMPQTAAQPAANCVASVISSSINLRSGPGAGYSVLGFGYQNQTFPVGGINPLGNWLLVGTQDGASAWLSQNVVTTSGDCSSLTVFDIPFRDVPAITASQAGTGSGAPMIVIVPGSGDTSGTFSGDDRGGDDHGSEDHGGDDGGSGDD